MRHSRSTAMQRKPATKNCSGICAISISCHERPGPSGLVQAIWFAGAYYVDSATNMEL